MWNYAKLSKLAKSNGGPERLVYRLIDAGVKRGRKQMVPVAITACVIGVAIRPSLSNFINYVKAKRAQSKARLKATEVELIQGIKDYDTAHEQEGDNQNE